MSAKRRVTSPGKAAKPVAVRKVRISEKDPARICGKGTSVERVFRVEEEGAKSKLLHLVFFDRHGWYCEHGAQCSAVADVKRYVRNSR